MPAATVVPSLTVCVFAKPPRAGVSKTRLGRQVGDVLAARLAEAFLVDTWSALLDVPCVRPVLAVSAPFPLPFAVPADCVWLQGEGDLGARQERVLTQALAESPRVALIGSDSPGLPPSRFVETALSLQTHDAVLGISDDGGYYLLGATTCPAGVLSQITWSAPDTGAVTLQKLRSAGLSVAMLPSWFDVDTLADLDRLANLLRSRDVVAPATAAVLEITPGADRERPATQSQS